MSDRVVSEQEELESLVGQAADDYTDRVNRGESVEIEEFAQRYPQIADVLRQMLPSLELMAKLKLDAQERNEFAESKATVPEYVGDYRILREVGRGGMGVVYEAEQKSLGRRVALKVLPFHRLMNPLYLKRFQREAQAAARLHHTNIVPVFGVGEHEGIHFYTMQFIAGFGLDRVITELRRLRQSTHSPADCGESVSAAGSISVIARSLCSGQYEPQFKTHTADSTSHIASLNQTAQNHECAAHSGQHFMHYCRSVARIGIQVAEALSHAHGQGVLHRDIKPSNLLLDSAGNVWVTDFGLAKAEATEDLTQTGDLVGTLRYTAPERMRGKSDARSDIFGLGLTLYELLTLQPAYAEKTEGRLALQVTAAAPPAPRKLDRRIPSDLNTIIMKAMSCEPEHRYPSAAELARDLQRFLDDRPIHARQTGQIELAWRWCRRNPLLAGLSAGFLASLLIGLVAVVYQWRLTERQRQRAEANFQTARDAVDECFTIVTENPVLQQPGMEATRHVLFQAALKYYQEFLNQHVDDPGTRADLARAFYRLGYITERIGSKSEAATAYKQGGALFDLLVGSDPTNFQLQRERALCHESLGELHRVTGKSEMAESELILALALRNELVRSNPNHSEYQNELASTHRNLGLLYRTTGRPAQAETSLLLAKELREKVLRASPENRDFRKALAEDYSELSRIYGASSRPDQSEAMLRKCLATLEALTRDFPEVSEYQDSLATGYNALGSFYMNSGRGEFNQIEAAYKKALVIREQLVREHPKVQDYQSELARLYNNLALWHFIALHDKESADNYAKALTLREQLARKHPDVIAYQKALAKTHHDLGLLFRRTGRWSDAERAFRRALEIQERLLERNREISDFALELATTLNNLGVLARDQGQYKESIRWYARSVRELTNVLKSEPQQTDARSLLDQAYAGRAESRTNLAEDAEALADWDRSLTMTRSDRVDTRRVGRATSLAHLGNYTEAIVEAERLGAKPDVAKIRATAFARVYAAAASAAARDPDLSAQDQVHLAEELAARSMEFLTRGYESREFGARTDVASLRSDRDFDSLRSRPDFIALLQKVEATDK